MCKHILIIAFCAFYVPITYAGAVMDAVLADQVIHEPVLYSYQETRHMQLLDTPWQASGVMLISPTLFVMEQQQPSRLVMASNRTTLWIYDSKNKIRRVRHISRSSVGITALTTLMMALRTGQIDQVKERYDMRLNQVDSRWVLTLIPVEAETSEYYAKIFLKGEPGRAADVLEIEYADGNRTFWKMRLNHHDKHISQQMKKLLHEARGG